jgi:hypothetical protein
VEGSQPAFRLHPPYTLRASPKLHIRSRGVALSSSRNFSRVSRGGLAEAGVHAKTPGGVFVMTSPDLPGSLRSSPMIYEVRAKAKFSFCTKTEFSFCSNLPFSVNPTCLPALVLTGHNPVSIGGVINVQREAVSVQVQPKPSGETEKVIAN